MRVKDGLRTEFLRPSIGVRSSSDSGMRSTNQRNGAWLPGSDLMRLTKTCIDEGTE